MSFPKTIMMSGIAVAALLATPALATDSATDKQKQQYLYQEQTKSQDGGMTESGSNDAAIGKTQPNSGPGVQGPADTRTGPSTRAPGGGSSGDASSGASSGDAGSDSNEPANTQPSQDSSGVQGFPDTRTGPATKGQ